MTSIQQKIKNNLSAPGLAIFFIVLGGFVLRVWGVNFGLPLLYHPDEPTFVRIAMHFGTGDLNPHWFGNPGNVFMYFLFFCYGLVYLAGYIFGLFPNPEAFVEYYRSSPTIFYLTGRMTEVVLSTASIYLVYKIAVLLKNRTAGLAAALFLATSPMHVEHSKYVRIDIMSAFFVLLAVFYCLRLLDSKKRIHYLAAGAGAGLALAAKYPTGAVIATVIFAFMLAGWEKFFNEKDKENRTIYQAVVFLRSRFFDRDFILGSFSILAAFAVTTPFFFIDFKNAVHDLLYEVGTSHVGGEKRSLLASLWWYAAGPLREEGMNGVIEILALGGMIWLLKEKNKKAWIAFSFFAIYSFIVGLAASQFSRWIIPLLPFLAIFAGVCIAQIFSLAAKMTTRRRPAPAALAGIIVALIFPQILQCIDGNHEFTRPDTRQFCKTWVEQTLPPNSRIAQEEYTYLPTSESSYLLGDIEVNGFYIYQRITLADSSFEYYQKNGFDYILISSWGYRRFGQIEPYRKFYEDLFQQSQLIKVFQAEEKKIVGPEIKVFKISAATLDGGIGAGVNGPGNSKH